jgi:hypothetical protein
MHNNYYSEHHCGPRFGVMRIIGWTIGGLVCAAVLGLLFGWFVQALWNWLMPGLFNLKAITYWQAFGIVFLAKILFGGFGRHYGGYHSRHRWKHHHKNWKNWCDDDEWKPNGSYRNWKYYDQYWHEEGKAAFEAYIGRIEKEEKASTGM